MKQCKNSLSTSGNCLQRLPRLLLLPRRLLSLAPSVGQPRNMRMQRGLRRLLKRLSLDRGRNTSNTEYRKSIHTYARTLEDGERHTIRSPENTGSRERRAMTQLRITQQRAVIDKCSSTNGTSQSKTVASGGGASDENYRRNSFNDI